MARYRDHHLDGTLIEGEWHEIKLGLVGGWRDGQLVSSSYVATPPTVSRACPSDRAPWSRPPNISSSRE